jgi:hypothetical protein
MPEINDLKEGKIYFGLQFQRFQVIYLLLRAYGEEI